MWGVCTIATLPGKTKGPQLTITLKSFSHTILGIGLYLNYEALQVLVRLGEGGQTHYTHSMIGLLRLMSDPITDLPYVLIQTNLLV